MEQPRDEPPTHVPPCGSWPSPLSADLVAAGGVKIEGVAVRGDEVWWLEVRPREQGRAVLVSSSNGDRLPAPWSARSRVHEYGGGAWWFGHHDVYFVDASDQAIHRLTIEQGGGSSGDVGRLSAPAPDGWQWRFADGREHPNGSLVICVRETHRPGDDEHGEPDNEIVAIATDTTGGGQPVVLVSGPDFVAAPRLSPDGRHLSWLQWDHPNMPWNETELVVAPLQDDNGRPGLGPPVVVAEGVSVCGPEWTSDGRLVYSTDADGYWNLRSWSGTESGEPLTRLTDGEIGLPAWAFGQQRWVELGDGRLAVVVTREAVDSLAVIEADGRLRAVPGFGPVNGLEAGYPVAIGSAITAGPSGPSTVAAVMATPTGLPQVSVIDVDSGAVTVVRPSAQLAVERQWLSVPRPIWFDSNGRSTHAFFYPPAPAMTQPGDDEGPGEKPPLIVIGHGGPTAHTGPELSLKVQYWTSRGFAVVDVNYAGSTGFGREYRRTLDEMWGVVDVDDCVNAAAHLVAEGLVDGRRLAIRGSSSGGLTVLTALIRSDRFAAGVSLYGVADLNALIAETHKFEARYLDRLIGPYPEELARYEARSPLNQAQAITTPMLLMQGTEDMVVPPAQSEAVVAALEGNEVDHLYVTFEGEGHGLRRAESIVTSLELELWFYGQVFGFEPADDVTVPDHAVGRGFGLTAPES